MNISSMTSFDPDHALDAAEESSRRFITDDRRRMETTCRRVIMMPDFEGTYATAEIIDTHKRTVSAPDDHVRSCGDMYIRLSYEEAVRKIEEFERGQKRAELPHSNLTRRILPAAIL